MGADEEGTLARLTAHRTELIDPQIEAHTGRVVKVMGDGVLVEFASVVDAIRCAAAIKAVSPSVTPLKPKIGVSSSASASISAISSSKATTSTEMASM